MFFVTLVNGMFHGIHLSRIETSQVLQSIGTISINGYGEDMMGEGKREYKEYTLIINTFCLLVFFGHAIVS